MEGMKSSFPRLRVQVGENGMGRREHSFLSIPLKPQIFIPFQNLEEWKEMKLDLMIFLLNLPKYPYIFNSLF